MECYQNCQQSLKRPKSDLGSLRGITHCLVHFYRVCWSVSAIVGHWHVGVLVWVVLELVPILQRMARRGRPMGIRVHAGAKVVLRKVLLV